MQATSLALKYRPKLFKDLVAQDTVSKSLLYALSSKRLAQAYLFSGLRGSGKTSTARIFARALLCEKFDEKDYSGEPCGLCPQCLDASNINIREMDAASNRGIDDVKDIIEQTKYAPTSARFTVFIIDEIHMLSREAFNALLKTLEEPPSHVKFILATTDPQKMPQTVLSRTLHFRFYKIPQSTVAAHLEEILQKEGLPVDKEALLMLARSCQGSMRDALTLLDQAIAYSGSKCDASSIASMLNLLDSKEISGFFEALKTGKQELLLEFLQNWKNIEASRVLDELCFYLKEQFLSNASTLGPLYLQRFLQILARSRTLLKQCDDDEFVLCVAALLMQDALQLDVAKNTAQTSQIAQTSMAQTSQIAQTSMPQAEQMPQASAGLQLAKDFLEKVKNRDFELGLLLEKIAHFKDCTLFIEGKSLHFELKKKQLLLAQIFSTLSSNPLQIRLIKAGSMELEDDYYELLSAMEEQGLSEASEAFGEFTQPISLINGVLEISSSAVEKEDRQLLTANFEAFKRLAAQLLGACEVKTIKKKA